MDKHRAVLRVLAAALSVLFLVTALPANHVLALENEGGDPEVIEQMTEESVEGTADDVDAQEPDAQYIEAANSNDLSNESLAAQTNDVILAGTRASGTVTTWAELQNAINNAADGDVITLGENITAAGSDSYINIPSGKNVTIDLNGKTLDRNRETADKNGHVIKVSGKLTVSDSVGGGVIKGGYATDGGGIYVDGKNAVLTFNGGSISENKASNNGGGIYNDFGKVYFNGGKVSNNYAGRSGGGLYFRGIKGNVVDSETGGEVEITSAEFSDNEAAKDGGAICLFGSTTTIHDVTVKNNKAGRDGGGIAFIREVVDDPDSPYFGRPVELEKFEAELNLYGGTVTGNSADYDGGGIYINKRYAISNMTISQWMDEDVAVNIKGKITVQDNTGTDFFLNGVSNPPTDGFTVNKTLNLTVVGPLTGSSVGIKVGDSRLNGAFTSGYSTNNPNMDPALCFYTREDGTGVFLENGEAVVKLQARKAGRDFVPIDSQIRSANQLTPNNWMAGISGERYLYEINTPHTHDSAMWKYTAPWDSSIGAGLGYHEYAHTQYASIKQQLEDGVRVLDLRLNPVYWGRDGDWRHGTMEMDDGENLWLCHGKNSGGGVYYSEDEDGNRLSLQKVLDWVQEFLDANPTETVILIFDAEITNANAKKGYRELTFQRIAEHLEKLAGQENPSNGKSYIYTEQGKTFRDKYTQWPQLKDCRGQAVIKVCEPEDFDYIGGFIDYGLAPVTDIAPEKGGGNCVIASEKIENLKPYFAQCEAVQIPKNVQTHLTTFHHADSNSKANAVTDFIVDFGRNIAGQTVMQPLAIARDVHKNVFQDEKYFEGDAIGNYYGFFKMDGAVRSENTAIWKTNFPKDLDYITLSVDPGTGGEAYLPQQFQLLRYTEVDIPGCIYDNPNENGGEFQYWEAYDTSGNKIGDFYEGDQYTVTDDIIFKAIWSDKPRTTIQIEWKDADNKDGLRPETIDLRVDDKTIAVTSENGWKVSYVGDIENVIPDWERIVTDSDNPYGKDTTGQYRYEVTGKIREGFVITLIHSPEGTMPVNTNIIWQDEENIDGLRPERVTLHLSLNGQEIQSANVTESDGWKYAFGEYRIYVDGEEAEYIITEDDIDGYSIVNGSDGDSKVYGSSIANIHAPDEITFSGYVTWDDNDNAEGERPESVSVYLLADEEEIASGEVTETVWGEDDHTGIWQWSITVYKSQIQNVDEITVKGKEIPRYSVEVKESDTYTRETIDEDGEIKTETVEVDPPYYEVIYTFNPDMPKEKVERVEPTCTEDGNIEYWYLDTEGEDGETVRKYFTDMSGEEEITEEETILPALGHDWSEWTVSKDTSAGKDGEDARTCSRCKETETRSFRYSCTDGDGNTWTKGEKGTISFTFKRSVDDGRTFTSFTGIQVDGKQVDKKYYSAKEGSVIITLNAEYLDTLKKGDHKLTAVFTDGSGEAAFKVLETAQPATGDNNHTMVWLIAMIAALLGMVSLFIFAGRKYRKKQR